MGVILKKRVKSRHAHKSWVLFRLFLQYNSSPSSYKNPPNLTYYPDIRLSFKAFRSALHSSSQYRSRTLTHSEPRTCRKAFCKTSKMLFICPTQESGPDQSADWLTWELEQQFLLSESWSGVWWTGCIHRTAACFTHKYFVFNHSNSNFNANDLFFSPQMDVFPLEI